MLGTFSPLFALTSAAATTSVWEQKSHVVGRLDRKGRVDALKRCLLWQDSFQALLTTGSSNRHAHGS